MAKKLMVTGPHGSKYLFDCPAAADADRTLAAWAAAGHHVLIGHPGTRVEWGDDAGGEFKPEKVIREGAKREAPDVADKPVPPPA